MVPKSNGFCTTFKPKYSYLRSSAIPTSHLLPFWGWGGLLCLCRGRGGHGGSSALPLHRWHDYEAKLQLETARGAKIEDPRDHRGHQGQQYPAVFSSIQQLPRSVFLVCLLWDSSMDARWPHWPHWPVAAATSRCRMLTQGLYIEQTASDWSEGWWLWTNRMIQVTDICKVSGCMDRKLLSATKLLQKVPLLQQWSRWFHCAASEIWGNFHEILRRLFMERSREVYSTHPLLLSALWMAIQLAVPVRRASDLLVLCRVLQWIWGNGSQEQAERCGNSWGRAQGLHLHSSTWCFLS